MVEPAAQAFMAKDVGGGTGEDHCFLEGAGVSGLIFEVEGADWAGCVWGESVAGDSRELTEERCGHKGVSLTFG